MEIRPLESADLEQAWLLDRDSFHAPLPRRDLFMGWNPPEQLLGAFDAGRLVAMTGTRPVGQFFGGRSVPMGAVFGVSVAPEHRRRGLARRVLREAISRMAESGLAISSLFPATTRLYRDMGYELGGCRVWRSIAPSALAGLPRSEHARIRAAAPQEIPAFADCYRRVARTTNGFLDRPDSAWQVRSEQLWRDRSIFVAEGENGATEGYLVYRQADGPYSGLGGPFRLVLDELLWSSRDAALALLGLLGSWASQVDRILLPGAAEDPLLLLLPEQRLEHVGEVRWMTRVVDPPAAVAARGFPDGLELEAHLALVDPLLSREERRFVLRVKGGRGGLEPGGRGGLVLDVGAFSSLFTGWSNAATLARMGRLKSDGAPLAPLDAAFGGPTPWMPEEF